MTVIPFPLHLSALNRSGEPNNRPRHQRVLERALTRYPLQALRNLHARDQAVGAANADRTILFRLDAANVEAVAIYNESQTLLTHAASLLASRRMQSESAKCLTKKKPEIFSEGREIP